MAFDKPYPFPAFNFDVEVDGLVVGSFSEVSGIESEIDIEEYKEGGVNEFVHKLLKTTKSPNLMLKTGFTTLTVLYDWYKQVVMGNIERKMVTITLLDSQKTPIKSWSFKNCIPVSWKGPELKSDGNAIAIESVQLAHQGPVWV
jgi:phage tail-like protein